MRMRATNISGQESARLSVPQAGKLKRNGQTGHSTPMSCSPTRMPASVGDKSPSHSSTKAEPSGEIPAKSGRLR